MDKDLRDSLRISVESIPSHGDNESFVQRQTRNYNTLYSIPEVREYYAQVVSAILLAYSQRFTSRGVVLTYRYKSARSIEKKMQEYIQKTINESVQCSQPMYDGFAMKMRTSEIPSLLYSRDEYKLFDEDKTLSQLAAERQENNRFLAEMQEFRGRLLGDEFQLTGLQDINDEYKTDVTLEEYFTNCIEILRRTRSITDPNETYVLQKLDNNIADLESNLRTVILDGDSQELVDKEDIEHEETGFTVLLDNFAKKMHNEITLAILTRQFINLFKTNADFFSQLGIELASPSEKDNKRKRTSKGYEANFIYIKTLYGIVEVQLQNEEQYQHGKTGAAAHSEMDGKRIDTVGIPSPEEIEDPEIAKKYLSKVFEISPSKFSAKPIVLNVDENIVEITEASAVSNYESIFSELQPKNTRRHRLDKHREKLELRKDLPIYDFPEKTQQYDRQSIMQYLSSISFSNARHISEIWHKNNFNFADAYDRWLSSRTQELSETSRPDDAIDR